MMMVMIVWVEVVGEFDLYNLNDLIFVMHIVAAVVVVVVGCHSTSVSAMNHLIKKYFVEEKKIF